MLVGPFVGREVLSMFIVRGAGQCVPRCGCYDFWRRLSTREGAAGRLIVSSAAFCRLFPCSLSYMLACLSSFGTRRFCVPKLLTVDCCTVVKKKGCFHLLHLLPPSPTFSNLLPPSPTFSNLLQPSPTFSHLLQPSPTFSNLLQPSPTFSNLLPPSPTLLEV